jgi:hypothetical protein
MKYNFIFLLLISCNNQSTPDKQTNITSVQVENEQSDNHIEIAVQKEAENIIETKNEYCPEINELDFYQKNGKITRLGKNDLIAELINDSIDIKILVNNCVIRYRSINSTVDSSYSFAKYYNGDLVFYDSIGKDGKHVVHFTIDYDVFDIIETLPTYLRNEITVNGNTLIDKVKDAHLKGKP